MGIIQTTKQLRQRDKADHYPTPVELCRAAINLIPMENPQRILDPGAGAGVWGGAAHTRWPDAKITGVEMDVKWPKNRLYWQWLEMDFLKVMPCADYDLIIGNPPYGRNAEGERDRRLAEKFVRHSWDMLKENGYICFLLRLGFLAGQDRAKNFWAEYPLKSLYVCSRRPSYTGNRKTDATEYAVYLWQKTDEKVETTLKHLVWDYEVQ